MPRFFLVLVLACAPALTSATCTAADVCSTAADYSASAVAGSICCNNADCSSYNYNQMDTACTGCTGTQYTTEATCNAAGGGIFWATNTCGTLAPSYAGYCNLLQQNAVRLGNDCCSGAGGTAAPSPPVAACTAANVCPTAADYNGAAVAGASCCNDALCTSWNYVELDTGCTGCTGTSHSTEEACAGAGKLWAVATCDQSLSGFTGFCGLLQTNAVRIGNDCCAPPSPLPLSPPPPPVAPPPDAPAQDPCFPSSAMVRKADGSALRVDALAEGDEIAAATANGHLTTDTVSLLSIAKPAAKATFVMLTTESNATLRLTPGHHVPIGATCCDKLATARRVEVGTTVWAVQGGAVAATTVTATATTTAAGLHSPVLANGGFPIVDGVVTSFDDIGKVTLAAYGLAPLLAACKATGTCDKARALLLRDELEYLGSDEA